MGILRREPGVCIDVPSVCGTAAERTFGAATAPAMTPPVVARKFRRVGESGSEFDIWFLDMECRNRTLYARLRFRNSGEELSAKNPKPPFRAALDSWVELLKLSGRRRPLSMRTLAVCSLNDARHAIAQKY